MNGRDNIKQKRKKVTTRRTKKDEEWGGEANRTTKSLDAPNKLIVPLCDGERETKRGGG